ncbi:hypothetical protein [Muninn virus]|nr:hypothetical protein [Muninn virus]
MSDKEPATSRQKRFILALGGEVKPDMSVKEASNLIDELLKNRQISALKQITDLCEKYAEIKQKLQQVDEKQFAELLIEQVEIIRKVTKVLRSLYNTPSYQAGVEIIKKFGVNL